MKYVCKGCQARCVLDADQNDLPMACPYTRAIVCWKSEEDWRGINGE